MKKKKKKCTAEKALWSDLSGLIFSKLVSHFEENIDKTSKCTYCRFILASFSATCNLKCKNKGKIHQRERA